VNSKLCAMALAFLLAACGMQKQTTSPPPNATTPPQPAAGPRVVLPDGFVVQVEIAADDDTRRQGLMYRDRLAADRGMLFLFGQSGDHPFWMKNTFIPLDIIWIDEQQRVAHVANGVQPCQADPCPSYGPGVLSKYVLELAAGTAANHRVTTGAQLRFEAVGVGF